MPDADFIRLTFQGATVGQAPPDWSVLWGSADHAWQVVADATATNGAGLRDTTNTNNYAAIGPDVVGEVLDSDQTIRFKSASTSSAQCSLVARGNVTATAADEEGYVCQAEGGDTLRILRRWRGSAFVVASTPFTFAINTYYWMRFQVIGHDLKAKAWTGDEGDEPEAWNIETTDRALGAGHCGVAVQRGTGPRLFDVYKGKQWPLEVNAGSSIPWDGTSFDALGGVVKLANGNVLATWRRGTSHVGTGDKGIIMGCVSTDNGRTWGTPYTIYSDATYDMRDPCPMQLPGGSVLISCFKYNHTGSTAITNAVTVLSSSDLTNWTPVAANSTFTDFEACAAPIVRLSNGNLLLPIYGQDTGDESNSSRVLRSTDSGATWSELATIANNPASQWQEPNIVVKSNGDLLCLIRTGSSNATVYASTSTDNGATWSTPTSAFAGIGAPRAILLSGGTMLVCYRSNTNNDLGYRTSTDEGSTWSSESTLDGIVGSSFQYGQWFEQSANVAGLAFWMKETGNIATGYVTYVDVS